jgi:hypothetical protein
LYDIDYAEFGVSMYLKMLQDLNKWLGGRPPRAGRSPLDDGLAFTIRFAYPGDLAALHRLAALDSQPVPAGPLLVAEVGGELWAAVGMGDAAAAIADPFHHTAELLGLLRERAERLTRQGRSRPELQRALRVASQ